jgi:hypothetical protein
MKKVMARIRESVAAEDPISIAYWQKAAAKQAAQMDKMRGKGDTTAQDVKRKFRSMGLRRQRGPEREGQHRRHRPDRLRVPASQ